MRWTWTLGAVLLTGGLAGGQQAAPAPPKVSGGVMAGQLLTKVTPTYPEPARAGHIQGAVVLHAIVGADGTVKHLEVLNGAPELRQAALDAVGQWTYKPFMLNGAATEVDTTVTVRFTLADATADPRPAKPVSEDKEGLPGEGIRVSGGVMAGQLITKVNPTYPPDAKAKGISGAVVLAAVIGKDGTVQKLSVVGGPEDLRDGAVEAVRQWVYKPYLLNGQPVTVQTVVTVNFTLGG